MKKQKTKKYFQLSKNQKKEVLEEMRQKIFTILSAVFFIFSFSAGQALACNGGGCSAPATAIAGSSSNSGASASAGANVGVVATGGSGGSASATGGSASITNKTEVSPTISPSVDVGIDVQPGQTVAPEQILTIDDHSVNKYINRQLPGMPLMGPPKTMEYFGPWQLPKNPWNIIPPEIAKFKIQEDRDKRISYDDIWEHIYHEGEFEPVEYVTQVPWGSIETYGMTEIGELTILLKNKKQTSQDGLQVARYKASQYGADLIEFLIGWDQEAYTKGYSLGFGGGATGVVTAEEKMGVSGASGTSIGKSSVGVKTKPFVKVRMWRTDGKKIISLPLRRKNGQTAHHVHVKEVKEKFEVTKNK